MTEQDVRAALARKGESKNVDFKAGLLWDKSDKKSQLGLVKDILAMANTRDGGAIILGVEDGTFEVHGLSQEQYLSFDQTEVNKIVNLYAEPEHTCAVIKMEIDGKKLVILEVPEFALEPIICKKNGRDSNNVMILEASRLYRRTDGATTEALSSAQDMRDLLRQATAKDSLTIIRDIERLLQGKPFADESTRIQFLLQLKEARDFVRQKIGKALNGKGTWEFTAYPDTFIPDHFALGETRSMVKLNTVNFGGWEMPHSDETNADFFESGFESFTIWTGAIEAWRFYRCGLFHIAKVLMEDLEPASKPSSGVDVATTIFTITEFILFLSRVLQSEKTIQSYHIEVEGSALTGRRLGSVFNPGERLPTSGEMKSAGLKVTRDLRAIDLKSKPLDIAKDLLQEIFLRFKGYELHPSTIDRLQMELQHSR